MLLSFSVFSGLCVFFFLLPFLFLTFGIFFFSKKKIQKNKKKNATLNDKVPKNGNYFCTGRSKALPLEEAIIPDGG